jgi:class 3 adenylate cyclase
MTWNATRAKERIEGFRNTTPEVKVERFAEDYLERRARQKALYEAAGVKRVETPPLYDLPNGAAVLVPDAVHVYVRALTYDEVRLNERGEETEYGHKRGLSFLDLLYTSGDRAVEAVGAQRVDFHGARMHAVIAEPTGAANLAIRIARAIAFAKDLTDLSREAAGIFARQQQFPLRFRIGIDAGTCVAMNSGRHDDREPVFIGPAANHAAKLAAGDDEGIYLSDRVRAALGLPSVGSFGLEKALRVPDQDVYSALRFYAGYDPRGTSVRLESWDRDLRANPSLLLLPEAFKFHEHTPPLSTIEYDRLSPSNSIRMQLVSLFADLDEYTRYIDHCMANNCLPTAVRLLHILRSEFNAVLQRDFGGRKLRFIGDCVQGLIAAGRGGIDLSESVELAALCAGGLRSSFELCQDIVEHADRVGLQIGFELGPTPVSRIGIRGNRAVRVASSLATRASEKLQQNCSGQQTVIGPKAYAVAPPSVKRLFGPGLVVTGLNYDDVATSSSGGASAAPAVARAAAPAILATTAAAAAPARAYDR